MKISDLFDDAIYMCNNDIEIKDITYHPEKSNSDSLLFLLNEKAVNDFKDMNISAKIVVTEVRFSDNLKEPKIIVDDARAALALAYKRLFCDDLSGIKFIGITGTNGKSTTALFLKKIMENAGMEVGLFGTGKILINNEILSPENYSMTTPPPDVMYPAIAKMKDKNADAIIMEVSSHALAQKRVYPLEFDVGVFTNLSEEHLDYHKDINTYFESKRELFYQSKRAIINTDDYYGRLLHSELEDADTIGILNQAKSMAKNIKDFGLQGTRFTYEDEGVNYEINLKIPATYNIYNALLAIQAARALGVSPKDVKSALEQIKEIDGRFKILHTDPTVVIDYAHTSFAFENFLKSLYSSKNQRQKLCVVFGCGGERDKIKRPVMGKCAEKYADKIIVTSDNPRGEDPIKIINDITEEMSEMPTIIVDRESAIRHSIQFANADDIVAIVGKGPEKYSIEKGIYKHFDEEEIVMNALYERKNNNAT